MKMFDLKGVVESLNSPNINSLLKSIEMYKGKTLRVSKLKKLDKMLAFARKKSVIDSCFIGNVFLTEQREKDLFEKGKPAETFHEHMILGYNEALDLINEVYSYQPFDRSFICTLHYYMYKDYNPEFGGKFKDTQNYIQEVMPDGSLRTVFVPAAPEETVILLENLLYQFNTLAADEQVDKLILTIVFLLDLICIHPFNHGNGRLSRLVLHFLLKKFGYGIDDYFAISYIIKHKIGDYIDALTKSTEGWFEGENDYTSYVEFMLKSILEAYRKLDYIMEVNDIEGTCEEKTLKIVLDSATPITKNVVESVLYNTSGATIEKALAKLVREGKIQLITKGRYSKYFRM